MPSSRRHTPRNISNTEHNTQKHIRRNFIERKNASLKMKAMQSTHPSAWWPFWQNLPMTTKRLLQMHSCSGTARTPARLHSLYGLARHAGPRVHRDSVRMRRGDEDTLRLRPHSKCCCMSPGIICSLCVMPFSICV
jgi:hypothetical protein